MLDGERLLAPTEAARQLDVSMRTIERLVASRPATPSNWRWLVGWSGARGQARDVPDGAFRRHMTAIVRSVVAAVAPSASRPDWQGARLTTCASCCVGLEAGPRPTRNSPSTGSARPVTVLRRATGRLAMATVAHRFDLTWSPGHLVRQLVTSNLDTCGECRHGTASWRKKKESLLWHIRLARLSRRFHH
jgi:hypothetical protein